MNTLRMRQKNRAISGGKKALVVADNVAFGCLDVQTWAHLRVSADQSASPGICDVGKGIRL